MTKMKASEVAILTAVREYAKADKALSALMSQFIALKEKLKQQETVHRTLALKAKEQRAHVEALREQLNKLIIGEQNTERKRALVELEYFN